MFGGFLKKNNMSTTHLPDCLEPYPTLKGTRKLKRTGLTLFIENFEKNP